MASNRDVERRNTPSVVEFRAAPDSGGLGTLGGYAAVFNKRSQNLGGFVERVAPEAFNKSLADAVRVVARFNHDDNGLLGTTDAGTVTLRADGTGLWYDVDLPDTTVGRDVAVLAKRGDLRFSSFAFRTITDEWDVTEDGFPLRTLTGVQLVDVAPVVTPAYLDSTTGMRSLAGRLHLDVEAVQAKPVEDLRALLVGEGQRETHPDPVADIAARKYRLALAEREWVPTL